MKVSSRLALAFGVVLVTMLTSSALSLVKIADVDAQLSRIVLQNDVKLKLNNDMSQATHVVARVLRTLILVTSVADREVMRAKIVTARASYDKAWAALQKMPASAAGQSIRVKSAEARKMALLANDKVMA